jgi:4-hydroxy-tetrahydrodipicolinate synthase
MATAGEARAWARGALRGIGDSLYTPFSGPDGDDIDWDAYRTVVRYCVGELGHPMLWCTSGVGEFWSLTLDERKRLLDVAIEEGRNANPDVVVQACTGAITAKDRFWVIDPNTNALIASAWLAQVRATPANHTYRSEDNDWTMPVLVVRVPGL